MFLVISGFGVGRVGLMGQECDDWVVDESLDSGFHISQVPQLTSQRVREPDLGHISCQNNLLAWFI